MKQHIIGLIETALHKLSAEMPIALPDGFSIKLDRTRDNQHGEYATNVAMLLAKHAGMKPRDLAAEITRRLPVSEQITKVEVAGPGFLNFFLRHNAYLRTIETILHAAETYGQLQPATRSKILLEYVSANPTGPLHIGHGRGAAYGDALANLLQTAGHDVFREYYVNDAGRQMDILAISVWLRYLQLCGHDHVYPENAYQADYVREIAGRLFQEDGRSYDMAQKDDLTGAWKESDPETRIDRVIEIAKISLGRDNYTKLFNAGLTAILEDIKAELREFGVTYDNWFSEQSLISQGLVDACIGKLQSNGNIYEAEGAKWFCSSKYGDEKDRVVERENGLKTYFASDIAYHQNKFERGFDKFIDIWGADHHGYMNRVKGAITALGHNAQALEILLVQFATLYRSGNKVQMSTRSGQYVTLRELRQEVGTDAARYFYLTRKSEQHLDFDLDLAKSKSNDKEQHLDFDLDLAKSKSNDNPVYYIQYAHARICSVQQQMAERGYHYDQASALRHLDCLTEAHELALMKTLAIYPEVIESAAEKYEPHQIGFYLYDLANAFHSYYNSHQFLVDDETLRQARI
ncbi:MAG: arginine--tRNA ligase, partial [Gammaproteobacteria bacterium]|nr:arginine--tRNA ligase [Gammaproteobacteria bacterium]